MAFTFFFRDLDCLEMAVEALLTQSAGRSRVRIWDAGCAMGHEPYTLAMLLAEKVGQFAFRNIEIHASDYDEPLLKRVQDGSYPYEEVRRVPEDYFKKYFEAVSGEENKYQIVSRLRETVKAKSHNLLSFSPLHNNFSLIVCKNVLLHFQPSERVEVIRMFHKALEPGGYFVTERTQKMPEEATCLFKQAAADAPLFQKIDSIM
jgi:chemotaxis protein methyltransferase CheR